MFVKVYQYHIKNDKVEDYLAIQEKVAKIYGKYIDFHSMYLNSKNDATKWIEITRYKDEGEYHKSIDLINRHQEIQDLFDEFQSLLSTNKSEVSEEDFFQRKEIHT